LTGGLINGIKINVVNRPFILVDGLAPTGTRPAKTTLDVPWSLPAVIVISWLFIGVALVLFYVIVSVRAKRLAEALEGGVNPGRVPG